MTAAALKYIDKAGGLDMYLLTQPAASHSSIVAEQLRGLVRSVRLTALRDASVPTLADQVEHHMFTCATRPLCACGKHVLVGAATASRCAVHGPLPRCASCVDSMAHSEHYTYPSLGPRNSQSLVAVAEVCRAAAAAAGAAGQPQHAGHRQHAARCRRPPAVWPPAERLQEQSQQRRGVCK